MGRHPVNEHQRQEAALAWPSMLTKSSLNSRLGNCVSVKRQLGDFFFQPFAHSIAARRRNSDALSLTTVMVIARIHRRFALVPISHARPQRIVAHMVE